MIQKWQPGLEIAAEPAPPGAPGPYTAPTACSQAAAPSGPAAGEADERILNIEKALLMLGGDRQIFDEVLCAFLDGLPEVLGRIASAVQAGDAQQLHAAAHRLKGGASAVMAESVRALAERLEELGRQGHLADAALSLCELDTEVDRLKEAVQSIARQGVTDHE